MTLTPATETFEAEVQREFAALHAAMGALLASLPQPIGRPTDLQKALGVHYKIAWHVFQVVHAADVMSAVKAAPTSSAMKRVYAAALDSGIDPAIVNQVRETLVRFEAVVAKHSDDRDEFGTMAAASSPTDTSSTDLALRKASYRAMSQLWGTKLDLACGTVLVRLSESGTGTDECGIILKQGLHRLRPDVPAVLQWQMHHDSSGPATPMRISALDPKAEEQYGIPLLPEFCSKPLPAIHAVPRGKLATQYVLADPGMGRSTAIDFTTGRIARQVPFSLDEDRRRIYRFSFMGTTATALLVKNLLVHRPSFGKVNPELMMFQATPGDESPAVAKGAAQLAVWEKVEAVDGAWRMPPIAEVPKYGAMVKYACDELGWDIGEFDLFRVKIAYPVLGSVCRLQFALDR